MQAGGTGGVWMSLITGLVSGLISAVLTYFSTRSKVRLDLTVEYDKELRTKRLELYKELWSKTEPLGRFAEHGNLTHGQIKAVSLTMHDWYFGEGGLYLSKQSRAPYFALKERMQRVIQDAELARWPEEDIDEASRSAIVDCASKLRTSLADDIRTRRAAWM